MCTMKYFVLLALLTANVLGSFIPDGLIPILDGRIVGGKDTTIEEFPHQVSLQYYGAHRCGGSVYKSNIIITAAHCVNNLNPKNLAIVAGTTYKRSGDIRINVANYIRHEYFHPSKFENDIALIILEKHLKFSDAIQPIAIPEENEITKVGATALVSGWGATSEGGVSKDVLQFVDVLIIDQKVCAKAYSGVSQISYSMICAGHPEGGRDSCQGDSGGPMIVNDQLIGIVSFGYGCARPAFPGVYARVSALRPWIDEKLQNL